MWLSFVVHDVFLHLGAHDLGHQVTLAVLQKFLYFTMAIVGTIGFQLKAGASAMVGSCILWNIMMENGIWGPLGI